MALLALRNLPDDLPEPLTLTAEEDGVVAGMPVRAVGYGVTVDPREPTTRRRTVDTELTEVTGTELFIEMAPNVRGGPCAGDSGGPLLVGSTIVGVNSRGTGFSSLATACSEATSVSLRISTQLPFVAEMMAGAVPAEASACNRCLASPGKHVTSCNAAKARCRDDAECMALVQCIESSPGTPTDNRACAASHPDGVSGLHDVLRCPCEAACQSECAGAPACATPRTLDGLEDGVADVARARAVAAAAAADRMDRDTLAGAGCRAAGLDAGGPWLALAASSLLYRRRARRGRARSA